MSSPRSSSPILVKGTCHHDCPDSCGWEVEVVDGVAVRMRGNADHPFSRGELCPKVNRFVDRVYNPDRVTTPLIRVGAKGTAEFRRATWDEALALVASRVGESVARFGGETVLPWGDAGTQGLLQMNCLDRRFFARLGASRQVDSLCGGTAKVASSLTLGSPLGSDPMDVRFSRLILLWGTNTRLTNRHLWPFIEEARANGARVVVIDPIRTITAESADWFIQPRPGTDVALMLAMMHVIIRDDLIDAEYVLHHTEGFDRLSEHVSQWSPQRAAEICGIDASDIETLARDYATTTPVMIRTLIGAEHRENGAMFFRAITCLPALVGAWRHQGGGFSRSVGSYAEINVDDSVFDVPSLEVDPDRRSLSMNKLGTHLTDATLDPPVSVLFVYNGNPMVTAPNADLLRRGLERDDLFTVVSEHFVTDTARYADVIFPACTQIEQVDVVPAWGHLYLGYNHKAIEPVGESVPNTELWRRLSRAMGFEEPELYESDESLLDAALFDLDRIALERDGFVRLSLPDPVLPYADGGYLTDSGRALLASHKFASLGLPDVPTYEPGRETLDGDASLLSRYPLAMMSPKIHVRFLNSSYSHLDAHSEPEGGMYCELHPDDAASRGITDGSLVRVRNDRASLTAVARVSHDRSRVRPGVVIVPFGWVGDRTNDRATVNMLTSDTPTEFGGGVAFYDTLVEVELA